MSGAELKFKNAPIVEAIIDIDCDFQPAGFDLTNIQKEAQQFQPNYPVVRQLQFERHQFKTGKTPQITHETGLKAIQFLQTNGKQLIQVRKEGYSFNRLAPYSSLDEYLPEVEKTWKVFCQLTHPTQVRQVRLRYINRLLLPMKDGKLNLEEYINQRLCPTLPDSTMSFAGFVHQHTAMEEKTGQLASIVLASEAPVSGTFSAILDVTVWNPAKAEPDDWAFLVGEIQSLRGLKNRIFTKTLTNKCLNLFQPLVSSASPDTQR